MAAKNPTVSNTDLQSIMWDMVSLGQYTSNRIQEIGMDAPDKNKYYSTPDGLVMQDFSVDNILFRDSHGMPISTESALASPDSVVQACIATIYKRTEGMVRFGLLSGHASCKP
jgi:hypothetical protein